jgi:predicted SprT family Zn-dependent metalloprotease
MSDGQRDNQATLFDWQGANTDQLDEEISRGTLDLSELPRQLRDRRAAAHRLHVRLEKLLGIVDLILTDNRRRMLSSRRRRNRQEIRAHHMFVGCGDETVGAIADLASGRKGARKHIQGFITDNREAISYEPSDTELKARGEHFDLRPILRTVREMFDDVFVERDMIDEFGDVQITWGRRGRGSKSIRFGSYDFDRKLIRIHPALDKEWVPKYFVEFIVYHELLHAIFPPRQGQTRREVHTPEFRAMEQQFPSYEKAMQWESANLRRILDSK